MIHDLKMYPENVMVFRAWSRLRYQLQQWLWVLKLLKTRTLDRTMWGSDQAASVEFRRS